MTMETMEWDAEFLEDRARDARDAKLQARRDADWEAAKRQFADEVADTVGCHRGCRLRRCRRARRCMGDAQACLKRQGWRVPPHVARDLTEEIYAEIQTSRRDAAGQDGEAGAC
jgi:hypothetical protein